VGLANALAKEAERLSEKMGMEIGEACRRESPAENPTDGARIGPAFPREIGTDSGSRHKGGSFGVHRDRPRRGNSG